MYNLYVLATHEHQTERPVTSERHRGIKSWRRKCQQPPSHPQPPPLFVHGAERSAHQEARPTASQSPSAPTLVCPWRRKVCTSGSTPNSQQQVCKSWTSPFPHPHLSHPWLVWGISHHHIQQLLRLLMCYRSSTLYIILPKVQAAGYS